MDHRKLIEEGYKIIPKAKGDGKEFIMSHLGTDRAGIVYLATLFDLLMMRVDKMSEKIEKLEKLAEKKGE